MKHRWPSSLHCQVEAVFHLVRAIREPKSETQAGIRSFGTWELYRRETHRFAEFMCNRGRPSILDTPVLCGDIADYLDNMLMDYAHNRRSRQTFETILAAFGKFEYALNCYIRQHRLDFPPLETEAIRMDFYNLSRKALPKSSKVFDSRAFPDPIALIAAIGDGTHQLQASLQYEAGMRAEGVGAPANRRLRNPLTSNGLRGIGVDPATGKPVGIVASVEKGGKETEHYVSPETYARLERHIYIYGSLESDYLEYVESINRAAKETGQYEPGRGSHGLKHNFAIERYLECVANGMSHEQALQQTSVETSHFRMRETLGYTRG